MEIVKKFFFIAGGVFLLDRITKTLFQKISVDLGFLKLHLVKNTGGIWGLFQGGNFLFILLTVIILLGILFYLRRIFAASKIVWVSFALVFGGGFGNLIDRIALGYVIDFIDFTFWPAFNIADSAISIAIILLLFHEFKPLLKKLVMRIKTTKRAKGLNTRQYTQ